MQESIGIYPKIITETFFAKTINGKLLIGLVVDVLYTTRMDVNAAEPDVVLVLPLRIGRDIWRAESSTEHGGALLP